MQRRQFLGASALFIGGMAFGAAPDNRIVLGGYGPSTSSFSQGLKFIGDRLEAKFGSDVDVKYVYNILDEGYDAAGELTNLVESGELSLAYLTMFANNPALQFAALPFFFGDSVEARAAMDGELGQMAIDSIESDSNLRVLGFFENGFRHVSNNVRPIRTPDDLRGLNIRVLSVQAETFRIMGANPVTTPLVQVYDGLASGELDGQENPFENVVTYDLYKVQKYYTETAHSYLSRPIFVHGPTFDAWPDELQSEMQAAVKDAVTLQRQLHDQAEIDAAETIREAGGEIIQLTQDERAEFLIAVVPILYEAQKKYGRKFVDTITP